MAWQHDDLTALTGAIPAGGDPTGYVFGARGTRHVIYRTANESIHGLFRDGAGWHHEDLFAQRGGCPAAGKPSGFATDADGIRHVFYHCRLANSVREQWHNASTGWHYNEFMPGMPAPNDDHTVVSSPTAWLFAARGTRHVVYKRMTFPRELWWDSTGWHHEVLPGTVPLTNNMAAYGFAAQGTRHVIYRGPDNHIHELWRDGAGWHHADLTTAASGAPPIAASDPAAYMFDAQGTQHVVYRAADNHIHELWWDNAGWHHGDLNGAAGGAPPADGAPAGYVSAAQGTQHVVYRGTDRRIHELAWNSTGWHHSDLTAATSAPANAAGDPAACAFDAQGSRHVYYRSTDNHIHEIYWR